MYYLMNILPSITKFIISPPLTHLKISNSEIEIKTDITTLCVKLDKNITLTNTMSSIIKQCNNKLYQL